MAKSDVTAERVRALLDYDPETGIFTRRISRGRGTGRYKAGTTAGCRMANGYITIGIADHLFLAHRLAWLVSFGKFPNGQIDHIDGNRSNNRLENLRDVSQHINMQNRKSADRDSKLGILGVTRKDGRFFAQIGANGLNINIGYFATAEAAQAAYIAAKRKLHPGFVE